MMRIARKRDDGGLTIIEVLISILLIQLFLFATFGLLAGAQIQNVKSSREKLASDWIKEDWGEVENTALALAFSKNDCTNGYASRLRDVLSPPAPSSPATNTQLVASRSLMGRSYQLTRTFAIDSTRPHQLSITYTVTLPNNANADDYKTQKRTVLSSQSMEIAPRSSYACQ